MIFYASQIFTTKGDNSNRVLHGNCGATLRACSQTLPQGKFHFTEIFRFRFIQLFLSQWCVVVVCICVPIGTIREEKRKGLVFSGNLNRFAPFSLDIHTRNYN